VIANLTTYFEEAREQIAESSETFQKLLLIAIAYLKKDQEEEGGVRPISAKANPSKKQPNT
jgi:hypothetical protein